MENWDAVSKSWDGVSRTGIIGFEIADDGLTLVHDSKMGL
jgi:hypothetical protein